MRHDKHTSRMGYDPAFWRETKKMAWVGVGMIALGTAGLVAIKLRPNLVEGIFYLIAFGGLMTAGLAWREMWDNRRYHPWFAERFRRPKND